MTLATLFRRRPPAPAPPTITRHDADTAHAHGLSWPQWLALTDHDRAKRRATITTGTNFQRADRR